jgi:hypothetical protein
MRIVIVLKRDRSPQPLLGTSSRTGTLSLLPTSG